MFGVLSTIMIRYRLFCASLTARGGLPAAERDAADAGV
jgi:hypothetical protein